MAVTTVNPSPGFGMCKSVMSTSKLSAAICCESVGYTIAQLPLKTFVFKSHGHHFANSVVVIHQQHFMGSGTFGESHDGVGSLQRLMNIVN